MTAWPIYRGTGGQHDGIKDLPEAPNWRRFDREPHERRLGARAEARAASADEVALVNAALFLRRPLLVTGPPGSGKSSLAYDVAFELGLGEVLQWPITSRSTVAHGLYLYDAISRLGEEGRWVSGPGSATVTAATDESASRVAKHVRLGPLGTALLPRERPRVLLIDEIDKGDYDLPNDLLNVFEDGEYIIEELARVDAGADAVEVRTHDAAGRACIEGGHVRCKEFPLVVMTSNGERDFPPAFLRRCLRLDLPQPPRDQLEAIVRAHLGETAWTSSAQIVDSFLAKRERDAMSSDQLLNALYLAGSGVHPTEGTAGLDVLANRAHEALMRSLDLG